MRVATAVLVLVLAVNAGAVVYVDKDRPGGDGSSWAAAFNTLQPAIDAAYAASDEVWVAAGDYDENRPFNGTPTGAFPDQENGSLLMRSGVAIYGGFIGDETQRDQRDWETNVTIINGVRARNGSSACHVVIGAQGALLDGFTISGGYMSPYSAPCFNAGAGMFIHNATMTVRNCTISDNSLLGGGGGLAMLSASGLFENCTFTRNSSNGGGAMVLDSSTPIFSKCHFENNTAYGYRSGSSSGGVANCYGASPLFINCVFWQNAVHSPYYYSSLGGCVNNSNGSSSEFRNCTFYGSIAANDEPLYNTNHGGAICSDQTSSATLTNCIVWGNIPDQVYGAATINNSDIQGGWQGTGNLDVDPLFAGPIGRLASNSLCLDAGTADSAPETDIRGVLRPYGSGVDMGAYEMVYPKAIFDQDKTSGVIPLELQFTNLTNPAYVTGWSWDFGDGSTSAEESPSHVYTTAGSFTASLTVTTIDGSDTRTSDVNAYANELVPAFEIGTHYARRPATVQFTDQSASLVPITSWKWTFGDGCTSTEQNPTHIYNVPGVFSVSLEVTAGGKTSVCTRRHVLMVLNNRDSAPRGWLLQWLTAE